MYEVQVQVSKKRSEVYKECQQENNKIANVVYRILQCISVFMDVSGDDCVSDKGGEC